MSDGAICSVFSVLLIRIEIGLVRGGIEGGKAALYPGPKHRTFELQRGINRDVPRDIIEPWLRKNRPFLPCIKDGRIRIVESQEQAA